MNLGSIGIEISMRSCNVAIKRLAQKIRKRCVKFGSILVSEEISMLSSNEKKFPFQRIIIVDSAARTICGAQKKTLLHHGSVIKSLGTSASFTRDFPNFTSNILN